MKGILGAKYMNSRKEQIRENIKEGSLIPQDKEDLDMLLDKAKVYDVTWTIALHRPVVAMNKEHAKKIVENIDLKNDGEYVSDSFMLKKVKEMEGED